MTDSRVGELFACSITKLITAERRRRKQFDVRFLFWPPWQPEQLAKGWPGLSWPLQLQLDLSIVKFTTSEFSAPRTKQLERVGVLLSVHFDYYTPPRGNLTPFGPSICKLQLMKPHAAATVSAQRTIGNRS